MSKLRDYRRRIGRISGIAAHETLALVLGLIVLPLLHVAIKLRIINISSIGRRIAGVVNRYRRVKECRDDIDNCCRQASQAAQALFIGVRFWRLGETSCVARSLLLWTICVSRRYPAKVWVGVARSDVRRFHTWVEVFDQVIDDSVDVQIRYQRFDEPLLDISCRVRNVSH